MNYIAVVVIRRGAIGGSLPLGSSLIIFYVLTTDNTYTILVLSFFCCLYINGYTPGVDRAILCYLELNLKAKNCSYITLIIYIH